MTFKLVIITPEGVYLEKQVNSLTVKLTTGYRTFLAKHAPLVGSLDYGEMHFVNSKNKTEYFAIFKGAVNVTNEGVTLITQNIESAKDIDVARAEASKARAEERLASDSPDIDRKRAKLSLVRALLRISVALLGKD